MFIMPISLLVCLLVFGGLLVFEEVSESMVFCVFHVLWSSLFGVLCVSCVCGPETHRTPNTENHTSNTPNTRRHTSNDIDIMNLK